jgi:hypothetical protein
MFLDNLLSSKINNFTKDSFNQFQLNEISQGEKSGVNTSLYAFPDINYSCMGIIRKALEKGLNIEPYIEHRLDKRKLEVIYSFLEKSKLVVKPIECIDNGPNIDHPDLPECVR